MFRYLDVQLSYMNISDIVVEFLKFIYMTKWSNIEILKISTKIKTEIWLQTKQSILIILIF